MYVLDGVPRAETYWPQNDWMTRENEPVLSPEKWKELIRLKKRVGRVEFRRVAGHKTNPHNKRVDKLAKESADLADRSRLPGRLVGRKLSKRSTEARSVPMRGQVEAIRIVVVRHVSARNQAYKYEVVARKALTSAPSTTSLPSKTFGCDAGMSMKCASPTLGGVGGSMR